MPVLKEEPRVPIGSVSELMAVARGIEQNAVRRYAAMAEFMRQRGEATLAGLFADLAEAEGQHVHAVEHWARLETGTVPAADTRAGPAALSDEEAEDELIRSNLVTPYRVLGMAVRNEERAFAIWSYIAAQANAADVRAAAERMAHEELEHAALLRTARRQAYRVEGRHRLPREVETVAALIARAAMAEYRLADRLASQAVGTAGEAAAALQALAEEARDMAGELDRLAPSSGQPAEFEDSTPVAAERLLDTYLDICDRARDEDIVRSVQEIARRAVRRLARLRAEAPGGDAKAPAV